MKKARFPLYISRPFQILWFEIDEIIIGVIFYLLTNIISIWFFPFIVAGPYCFKSIKSSRPRGFIKHLFYMCGFARFKGYPIYFEKDFQE